MSKQKQEIIPKSERVKKVQTKHRLNDEKKKKQGIFGECFKKQR